jgi:hypothetical protein
MEDADFAKTISDPRLLGLYRYWAAKAGDRPIPRRDDLDPIEMKPWLANLILVEFKGVFETYRVKLEGTNIETFYRERRTGRGIEALTSEAERQLMKAQYWPVVERGKPAFYEAEFINSEGKLSHQVKLLLPLSEDGITVNMVLGGIYFKPPDLLGR